MAPVMVDSASADPVIETVASYDAIASEYAERFAAVDLRDHRHRFEKGITAGMPILDAGCGPARDCAFFEADGFQVVGVDLSKGLLRLARERTTASLVHGDIR